MGHAVGLQEKVASNFVFYMDFTGILRGATERPLNHSTNPYLTLMRSSFSSIGSASSSRKITVAQA